MEVLYFRYCIFKLRSCNEFMCYTWLTYNIVGKKEIATFSVKMRFFLKTFFKLFFYSKKNDNSIELFELFLKKKFKTLIDVSLNATLTRL